MKVLIRTKKARQTVSRGWSHKENKIINPSTTERYQSLTELRNNFISSTPQRLSSDQRCLYKYQIVSRRRVVGAAHQVRVNDNAPGPGDGSRHLQFVSPVSHPKLIE